MGKIYTRTGDRGETALLGGDRVRKDDLRIEAIGNIDETNASLGVVRVELARSGVAPEELDGELAEIQRTLFEIGAELASRSSVASQNAGINDKDVAKLETAIDRHEAGLDRLLSFILPGGAAAAAQLHLARCICRRAERRLVELAAAEPVRFEVLQFINRLGDLLFVLARVVNRANRVVDVAWNPATTNDQH